MRRKTYGCLPSRRFHRLGRYQIILLGDRAHVQGRIQEFALGDRPLFSPPFRPLSLKSTVLP